MKAVEDSGRGGALLDFFFTKTKFTSKKLVLNEYEICLKALEMVILEIQIFKTFWRSMTPDPLEISCLGTHGASSLESPGSAPGKGVELP